MTSDLLPNMAQSIKAHISREIAKRCPCVKHATVFAVDYGRMKVVIDGTKKSIPIYGNSSGFSKGQRVAILKDKNNFYLIGLL